MYEKEGKFEEYWEHIDFNLLFLDPKEGLIKWQNATVNIGGTRDI